MDTSKLCASPSSEVNGATGVMIRDQGGLYKQWKTPASGLSDLSIRSYQKPKEPQILLLFPAFHHLYVVNAKSTPGGQSEEGGVPWPA